MPTMFRSRALLTVAVATATFWTSTALANDPRAEALYQEGRQAAEIKDWALACKKFKESQEREPAPGTLLNLADCEENRGKFLDAAAHFELAARTFRPGDTRATYARDRASSVAVRTPRLTIRLSSSLPTGAAGAIVECDGAPIDPKLLGTPIPLDPGEHVVIVRSAGQPEVRRSLRLGPTESRDVEFVVGGSSSDSPASSVPAPIATAASVHDAASRPPHDSTTDRKDGSTMRTAGIVALGVGGVGLGVGILGAIMTLDAKSTVDAECPAAGCSKDGLDAQTSGKTWSAVGTAGFIAAGVGVAAGVTLLVLAPSSKPRASASVYPIASGFAVGFSGSY